MVNSLRWLKHFIKKHPCLKEQGSVSGYCGWKTILKYKLGDYRTKLRSLGCPAVTLNSLKHKPESKHSPAHGVKKVCKTEVNYCPSYLRGETYDSLENMRVSRLSEIKKINNDQTIKMLMEKDLCIEKT